MESISKRTKKVLKYISKGKPQSDDFLKKYENEIDTLWDKKYIERSIIDYSSTWEPIFSKCEITDDGKAYLESEKRSRICFLIPIIISILGVLISFFRYSHNNADSQCNQ